MINVFKLRGNTMNNINVEHITLTSFLKNLTSPVKHPDADFILEFINDQRKNGNNNDEDLLCQCIEYIIYKDGCRLSDEIQRLNKQVYDGINALKTYNRLQDINDIVKYIFNISNEAFMNFCISKD
jgi:hypothetical protein